MRLLIPVALLALAGCSTVAPNYQLVGIQERLERQDVAILHSGGIIGVDRTRVVVNTGVVVSTTGYVVLKPGLHEVHYQLGSPDAYNSGGVRSNVYFKAKPGHTYRLRTGQVPFLGYIPALGQRAQVVDVTADPKWHVTTVDAAFAGLAPRAAEAGSAPPAVTAPPVAPEAPAAAPEAAPVPAPAS